MKAHKEKVANLNKKIDYFEQRRKAFEAEVDVFNAEVKTEIAEQNQNKKSK